MGKKTIVYVSSWSRSGIFQEAGLGVYEMDTRGTLSLLQKIDQNISFHMTYVDRRHSILYALNETEHLPDMRAGGGGQVFVYKIDADTGMLSKLGSTPTWCPNPCYIALDTAGEYAVVANHGSKAAATRIVKDGAGKFHPEVIYDDSVVELFEVLKDGTLGELLDVDWHYGDGPEERQVIPHPHSAVMSPDGSLFAVCDKGNDTISMYQIDRVHRLLKLSCDPLYCRLGSLPRYCVFHPTLPYFYHNNENNVEMNAYRYDLSGQLSSIGTFRVLPESYLPTGARHEQQGLCIHPNGKYIYDVVRGPNMIAVLKVDESDGSITLIQNQSIDDAWPRGCALTEDGRFLIVCGLDKGKVFVYDVADNGQLTGACREYQQTLSAYVAVWTPD